MGNQSVCPWQGSPILTMRLRMLAHNPNRMLSPYFKNGMTALEIGCGMGYFTIPMAEMVGSGGKVIAADLQPQMLDGLKRRTEKKECRNIYFSG